MQCPRCGRSLLALARRPSSWLNTSERGQWIGLHPGDTHGTSDCRLAHDEAIALGTGAAPQLVPTTPSWPRAA